MSTSTPDETSDFLDRIRDDLRARIAELRPAVDEFNRLKEAEGALSGRPAAQRSSSRPGGAARRPRENGTRAQQTLALVKERPGITIPELAQAMDIKQNYLYRVIPDLAEQGLVEKVGRGWQITEGAGE